jgi:hypothetical protein
VFFSWAVFLRPSVHSVLEFQLYAVPLAAHMLGKVCAN